MDENTHDLLDSFSRGQPRQGPSMKQVPAGTPIAQEPLAQALELMPAHPAETRRGAWGLYSAFGSYVQHCVQGDFPTAF